MVLSGSLLMTHMRVKTHAPTRTHATAPHCTCSTQLHAHPHTRTRTCALPCTHPHLLPHHLPAGNLLCDKSANLIAMLAHTYASAAEQACCTAQQAAQHSSAQHSSQEACCTAQQPRPGSGRTTLSAADQQLQLQPAAAHATLLPDGVLRPLQLQQPARYVGLVDNHYPFSLDCLHALQAGLKVGVGGGVGLVGVYLHSLQAGLNVCVCVCVRVCVCRGGRVLTARAAGGAQGGRVCLDYWAVCGGGLCWLCSSPSLCMPLFSPSYPHPTHTHPPTTHTHPPLTHPHDPFLPPTSPPQACEAVHPHYLTLALLEQQRTALPAPRPATLQPPEQHGDAPGATPAPAGPSSHAHAAAPPRRPAHFPPLPPPSRHSHSQLPPLQLQLQPLQPPLHAETSGPPHGAGAAAPAAAANAATASATASGAEAASSRVRVRGSSVDSRSVLF